MDEERLRAVIAKLEETRELILKECPELKSEPDMYVTDFAMTLSGRICRGIDESIEMLVGED